MTRAETWSYVSCDTAGALSVETIDDSATGSGPPAFSASDIACAPSVSTPHTRSPGLRARNAAATPEISAPPPTLTRTSVRSPASAANSRPTVPWPASTTGSSKGWTSVSPSCCSRVMRANALSMPSVSRTDAPASSAICTARAGAERGITTVAFTCRAAAITASAIPWLPPLTATTPAARSASSSDSSFAAAPRALNEPVRCSSSSLAVTGTPSSADNPGLSTVGVCTTCPAIRAAAASNSGMPITAAILPARVAGTRRDAP